jgi:Mg2+/Co2+ transporter CorB
MSSDLQINADAADLTCRHLTITGAILQAAFERIKIFANSLDSLVDRLHERVKRSYRFVEETDQVRAENIDHRAEKLLNLRGENAVINARELVKVDGEQIHFG